VHPAYDGRSTRSRRRCAVIENSGRSGRCSGCCGQPRRRAPGAESNVSFPGALAWPYLYPWPQRPPGLIETAFDELAKRWRPIFDAYDEAGCSVAFELHPGEDLFDGVTFEMFLERVDNHPRCCINYDPSHFLLQQLDYLEFIDIYHERITSLHIKDAEFRPTGKQGVYSGYQPWLQRAGRFRSLGDDQIDFGGDLLEDGAVRLRQLGGAGVGVLPEAPEAGQPRRRIHRRHLIRVTEGVRRLRRRQNRSKQARRMLGL
jgi:hypothetical protein